jgi:hypothetical protein
MNAKILLAGGACNCLSSAFTKYSGYPSLKDADSAWRLISRLNSQANGVSGLVLSDILQLIL